MSEFERKIALKEGFADVIFSSEFEQEQQYRSSSLLVLEAFTGDNLTGYLNATFYIHREVDTQHNVFFEQDRTVRLSELQVAVPYKRNGFGSLMIVEVEKQARRFGASRMEGILALQDRIAQPWLVEFYIKHGFEIQEGESDFKIVKEL